MRDYSTIEEKAGEWNISIRHIQHLCRNGKIDGAMKRAGVWFIPDDAPIPSKNTKTNVTDFKFVGTKNKIFETSIELFLLKGFGNVSIKDIAASAGVRQTTVYSHFKSKQEILNTIYDFYCFYYTKERVSLEDMDYKLRTESIMDIIGHIRYEFKEDYLQKMSDITKIVFQRIGVDDRAREIAKSLMVDEGIRYAENVFSKAVEGGRLAPFDTHAMSVFINAIRIFTLYCWATDPSAENMFRILKDEQTLYEYSVRFLNDLKPPLTSDGTPI